ncbi:MAG: hypothetical protein AB7K04_16400 [Pseudorhodoplanes sp.]
MRILLKGVLLTAAFVAVVLPAQAEISAELARKCRAMMIRAHPTELFGPSGSAAAQRAYFQECVSQQGKMNSADPDRNARPDATTGSGSPED